MRQKQKKHYIKLAIQFLKLQLAGNVLFWGTYLGFFLLDTFTSWPDFVALAVASVAAHVLFFIVDKEWVFADSTGRRKKASEITRFVVFMGFNYFLNLAIIGGLSLYWGLTPYIGQFVSALFFTVWNYAGLKFWVFQVPQHHALTVHKLAKGNHGRRR